MKPAPPDVVVLVPPEEYRVPPKLAALANKIDALMARALEFGDEGEVYGLVLSVVVNAIYELVGVKGTQQILRRFAENMPAVGAMNDKAGRRSRS